MKTSSHPSHRLFLAAVAGQRPVLRRQAGESRSGSTESGLTQASNRAPCQDGSVPRQLSPTGWVREQAAVRLP